jgi:hypothetical protein
MLSGIIRFLSLIFLRPNGVDGPAAGAETVESGSTGEEHQIEPCRSVALHTKFDPKRRHDKLDSIKKSEITNSPKMSAIPPPNSSKVMNQAVTTGTGNPSLAKYSVVPAIPTSFV